MVKLDEIPNGSGIIVEKRDSVATASVELHLHHSTYKRMLGPTVCIYADYHV